MTIRDTDYKPNKNVPLRSPLAFGGFILHYLRIRFSESWDPPYVYRPDDTETELFIVSGNTIANEIQNNRPAIYVNMGSAQSSDFVIGDRAHTEFFRDKENSYTRVDMSVTINCESPNRGESHGIGWLVYTALLSAKDVLRTKYQIANMGPFELIPPRPSKKDRETFISTINFRMSYELSWNVDAVQTVIREFELSLDLNTNRDPSSYLTKLYVQSLDNIN